MNKFLFSLVLFLGVAVGASAQTFYPLKVALTNNPTYSIPLANSRTDTTNLISLSQLKVTKNDTLLVAAVWTTADSMKAAYKVQYFVGNKLIATSTVDSVSLAVHAGGTNTPARGVPIWAVKHPAATGLRIILATAATGNENGLASETHDKRVQVGVIVSDSKLNIR